MQRLPEDPDDPRQSGFAEGPRRCTDVAFLLLFAAMWVLLVAIAGVGLANGEPEALLFGTDHAGRVCGGEQMRSKRNIYYPRLQEDLIEAYASDPARFDPAHGGDALDVRFYGVCVDECPQRGDVVDNGDAEAGSPWAVTLDTDTLFFRCFPEELVERNTSILCVQPSGEYDPVDCSPDDCEAALAAAYPLCTEALTLSSIAAVSGAKDDPIFDQLNQWYALARQHLGAVELVGAEIFLCGVGVAGALSLAWVLALKHFASCMVAFTLVALVLVEAVAAMYLSFKAGLLEQEHLDLLEEHAYVAVSEVRLEADRDRADLYRAMASVAYAVTVLTLCVLMALRSRILLSVGLIRESARALQALPGLVLFPVAPMLLGAALFAFFAASTAYVATSGSVSAVEVTAALDLDDTALNGTLVAALDDDDLAPAFMAVNAFGFLWSVAALKAVAVATVSGAVCQFYWAPEGGVPSRAPVLRALATALRYHLGSLCFGALIIALVQAARVVLAYVHRRTRGLQRRSGCARACMCCLQLCLWCFEKCVRYISKNAFVMVAMKGENFCTAVRSAFTLLLANALAVATLSMLVHVLVFFGKLIVTVSAGLLLFYRIHDSPDMPSPLLPVLLTLLLAYTVASLFFGVYLAGVDTIVLSFCEDRRLNAATGEYFMRDSLRAHLTGSGSVARAASTPGSKRALGRLLRRGSSRSSSSSSSSSSDKFYSVVEQPATTSL